MNRDLSIKFRFLTFACIALLPWVHGYNLNIGYLTPYTMPGEPLTFTTFFEYFVANGLLRFRIPVLFLISGYLYAYYDHLPNNKRIGKRFKSLIIPYLLWSAFGILLTFALQQFPYTAQVVKESMLDQMGDNRPYTDIGLPGLLFRWLLAPPSFQLWFIMVLFIYNLLYPLLRWLVQRYASIWLPFAFLLWMAYVPLFLIEAQGLFFFSMGVWLCVTKRRVESPPRWFSLGLAWIFFVGVCLIKTFMAFELEAGEKSTLAGLAILHKMAVVSGVLAVWFSVGRLAKKAMSIPLFRTLTTYAFFIYGMHIPLQAYLMQWSEMLFSTVAFYRLFTYLLVPALCTGICVAAGSATKRYWPQLYSLLSGGRGI